MFTVISFMFGGVAVGYLFRRFACWQQLGRYVTYTIYTLLFLLGGSVGMNPQIVQNLGSLGLQALLIASAGTLGSVLLGWLVYRFFFQRKGGMPHEG